MKSKYIETNLNSSYVTYFGDIKIKVVDKKGNQKGKTMTFKNNGRWPLFLFLTTCLDGNYDEAELMRPKYIELFHCGNAGSAIPTITDESGSASLSDYINGDNRKTLITYTFNEGNAVTKDESTELGSSDITYKFLIPFAHIDTSDDINGIALYSSENYQNYEEPSAFFFVKNSTASKKFGSLLEGSTTNKNYNLIIEWKLTLKNVTSSN